VLCPQLPRIEGEVLPADLRLLHPLLPALLIHLTKRQPHVTDPNRFLSLAQSQKMHFHLDCSQ